MNENIPAASGAATLNVPSERIALQNILRHLQTTSYHVGKQKLFDIVEKALEDSFDVPAALVSPQVAPAPVLGVKRSEWEALSPEAQDKLLKITGAGSRNLARAQATADIASKPLCTQPPTGWTCSRGAGHDGPCASSPIAAPVQVAPTKVYLVATGEVVAGLETYTRHDGVPPPLCDSELLYSAPVAPQDDARDAAEALTDEQLNDIHFKHIDRNTMDCDVIAAMREAIARSIPAAKPTEPTLPTQGEQNHD